ncbi:MAG: hypothetical protein U0797_20950 [Gemmataceae bacterium]
MRRASERRCRSSLAWGAALFLATQVGFSLGLDRFAPLARFPSARSVLRAAQAGPPPSVVFFGSSRLGASLDAAEVNRLLRASLPSANVRALNAAVPAGDAISTEFLLGRLLEAGGPPDWVFVEVSPENLNDPGPWLGVQVTRQLGWKELPTHLPEAMRSNDGMRYLGSLLLPGHVHREAILGAAEEWRRPPLPFREDSPAAGPIDWQAVLPAPEVSPPADHRVRLHPGALAARRWLRLPHRRTDGPPALGGVLRPLQAESIGAVLLIPPLATGHRSTCRRSSRRSAASSIGSSAVRLPDPRHPRLAARRPVPRRQPRASRRGWVPLSRLLTRRVLLDLLDPRRVVLKTSPRRSRR